MASLNCVILLIKIVFLVSNFQFSCACKFINETKPVNCSKATDMFVIIDTSDKIDKNEFDVVKVKISQTIKSLNISGDNLNLALMSYSDKIKLIIPLSKKSTILDFLISKIISLEQDKNGNMLPRTLHYIQSFILKNLKTNGNNKKLVVLITDGSFNENEFRLIRKEANLLKNIAELMAIRVGKDVSRSNLKMIVSCPNYLVNFESFPDLAYLVVGNSC